LEKTIGATNGKKIINVLANSENALMTESTIFNTLEK